jgi:uncharacterized protein with HEPN domain
MRLEAKKYLYDIQQAADLLAAFTEGKSFADYQGDAMLRAAVERQFEIIGEALAELARLDESLAAGISEYRRIIAFRNILIHGYAQVATGSCGTSSRPSFRRCTARWRRCWKRNECRECRERCCSLAVHGVFMYSSLSSLRPDPAGRQWRKGNVTALRECRAAMLTPRRRAAISRLRT